MNTQGIESNGIKIREYTHYEHKMMQSKIVNHEKVEKDGFEHQKELDIGKYDASGKVDTQTASKFHLILAIQKQVDEQVQELTKYYLSIFEKSDEGKKAKESLATYFNENPEALEEIENGDVPEYWNQENTAKRIFDIVFSGFNKGKETDMDKFYEKSKSMIEQAYSEVEEMVGGLPTLVTDTKEAVLNGLEQFKDGKDISEITFS